MDKEILIRCSGLGKIMSCLPTPLSEKALKTFRAYEERYNGIGKPLTSKQLCDYTDLMRRHEAKPKMSVGTKTFADQLFLELFYDRRKEVSTKYMQKGKECEEGSVTLLSSHLKKFLHTKTERKKNKWLTGLCDIDDKEEDRVTDIKTSFQYSTFPILQDEPKNKLYEWQLRGYMMLYNRSYASLAYCLENTPFHMIEDEMKRVNWNFQIFENGEIIKQRIPYVVELVKQHIFDKEYLEKFCHQSAAVHIDWFKDFKTIETSKRVKIYEFKRCKEKEQQIIQCCELVQNYIKSKL